MDNGTRSGVYPARMGTGERTRYPRCLRVASIVIVLPSRWEYDPTRRTECALAAGLYKARPRLSEQLGTLKCVRIVKHAAY